MTGPKGPGQLTTAKCYRLLKAICATAARDELITANPCTIRGAGQEPETKRAMISVELVEKVANEVDGRWRLMVLLAAWCALRFGEMAALRRNCVNLDQGTLEVSEAASRLAKGVLYVWPPKSSAGRRTVTIPLHIIDDLRYHLEHYAEPSPDGLVFVGPKGAPLRNSHSAGPSGDQQDKRRACPRVSIYMTSEASVLPGRP
jgi:integrase